MASSRNINCESALSCRRRLGSTCKKTAPSVARVQTKTAEENPSLYGTRERMRIILYIKRVRVDCVRSRARAIKQNVALTGRAAAAIRRSPVVAATRVPFFRGPAPRRPADVYAGLRLAGPRFPEPGPPTDRGRPRANNRRLRARASYVPRLVTRDRVCRSFPLFSPFRKCPTAIL